MEDNQKISMRDAFWSRVYELASQDHNIVALAADMGAPALDRFRNDLAAQYVSTGIAEQNAAVVAAGLALGGKKVFAYAIAPFITLRCYEQIKVDLAGMKLPVTLVGVGAGFSYEDSGPTHHTVEDLAIMRILPNFIVLNASDFVMAKAFADISYKMEIPNYVRLDREVLPTIYQEGMDFSSGISVLKEGKDLLILATGNMVHRALEVSEELAKKNITAGVIDVYKFPIDEKLLLEKIGYIKKIITLEEHTLPGGFGGHVAEILSDNQKFIPLKRIGLNFKDGYCYKYGGRKNIHNYYGLDKENLTKKVMEFVFSGQFAETMIPNEEKILNLE